MSRRGWRPHRVADRLTARALRLALGPGWNRDAAAAELAGVADGHVQDLEFALERLEREQASNTDRLSRHAAESLQQALTLARPHAA